MCTVLLDALVARKSATSSEDTATSSKDAATCEGIMCVSFQTSCKEPLYVGDVYGSISVVGFINDAGVSTASCLTYFDPECLPLSLSAAPTPAVPITSSTTPTTTTTTMTSAQTTDASPTSASPTKAPITASPTTSPTTTTPTTAAPAGTPTATPTGTPTAFTPCTPTVPCDACPGKAKLTALHLHYTGLNEVMTSQPLDQVQIVGDTGGLTPVDVVVEDTDGALVAELVALDVHDTFTVTAGMFPDGKFPPHIIVSFYDTAVLRKSMGSSSVANITCKGLMCVSFATSCAHPVLVGDTYGAVQVLGFVNDDGSTEAACPGCDSSSYLAPWTQIVVTFDVDFSSTDLSAFEAALLAALQALGFNLDSVLHLVLERGSVVVVLTLVSQPVAQELQTLGQDGLPITYDGVTVVGVVVPADTPTPTSPAPPTATPTALERPSRYADHPVVVTTGFVGSAGGPTSTRDGNTTLVAFTVPFAPAADTPPALHVHVGPVSRRMAISTHTGPIRFLRAVVVDSVLYRDWTVLRVVVQALDADFNTRHTNDARMYAIATQGSRHVSAHCQPHPLLGHCTVVLSLPAAWLQGGVVAVHVHADTPTTLVPPDLSLSALSAVLAANTSLASHFVGTVTPRFTAPLPCVSNFVAILPARPILPGTTFPVRVQAFAERCIESAKFAIVFSPPDAVSIATDALSAARADVWAYQMAVGAGRITVVLNRKPDGSTESSRMYSSSVPQEVLTAHIRVNAHVLPGEISVEVHVFELNAPAPVDPSGQAIPDGGCVCCLLQWCPLCP